MGEEPAGLSVGGTDCGAREPDRDVDGDDLKPVEQGGHVVDDFHAVGGGADPSCRAAVEADDRAGRRFDPTDVSRSSGGFR